LDIFTPVAGLFTIGIVIHTVDLSEIQNIVSKYASQSNLLTAAGPVTAATAVKMMAGKNKLASLAVVGGGVWFAVQELQGPLLHLMQDQFGYLQEIFGAFRG
jgi:hypothetical protein